MIQFVFTENTSIDDQSFFTTLYFKYESIMYSTARNYIYNHPQAAEDIVQDSVEKLIKKIPTLRTLNSCTLPAYIVYTVRNTALNYLRRESLKNSYFISEQDTLFEFSDDDLDTNPESAYLRAEFSNETWKCLSELPEKYLILLKGKYVLSLDDRELAEIIGCKPSSVRMYLTRARRSAIELITKGELIHD